MIYFYSKNDPNKEPIGRFDNGESRLLAAQYFANRKRMSLKNFLNIFSISKN